MATAFESPDFDFTVLPRPRRSDSGLEHPDIASMEGRQRIGRQLLLHEGKSVLRFPSQVARSLRVLRLLSTHRRNQQLHAPNRSRDFRQFLSLQGEFPSPQRLWLRGPRSFQTLHSYSPCIRNNRRGAISASHVADLNRAAMVGSDAFRSFLNCVRLAIRRSTTRLVIPRLFWQMR